MDSQAKLQEALAFLSDVFKGEDVPFTSYDERKKAFILVASGDLAEPFRRLVLAAIDIRKDGSDKIVKALTEQSRRP